MITVINTSILDNKEYTMDIDTTKEKLMKWESFDRSNRPHIQEFFSELTPDEHEFILSGIIPEIWDEVTKEE